MPTFVEELAARHLGGPLPADFIEIMAPLDHANEETQACVRRAFRLMEKARFRPIDFPESLAVWFAQVVPGMLPGAWGGSPPPITTPGRHERYDDYIEDNPWLKLRDGARFLDVGCGFPPFTTIDTATRFPEVQVEGIDPAFGRYLVYDEQGDYACIGDDGAIRFIGTAVPTPENMRRLWGTIDANRGRFAGLVRRLEPLLPPGDGLAEATDGPARIVRRPEAQYEGANLRLTMAAIGATDLERADVIRCMAVMIYFDREFRERARTWAGRMLNQGGLFLHGGNSAPFGYHRYGVWRREDARLVPREFAISADSLRSPQGVPWYTFQPDEEEAELRADLLGALWSADDNFRASFDAAADIALEPLGQAARRPDGQLGRMRTDFTPDTYRAALVAFDDALMAGGWVDRAAEVLTRATGRRAWRNSIGHLAVDPVEWGWEPIALE